MKRKAPVSVEQMSQYLGEGVTVLDRVRAAQIADGLRMESAKGAVLAREHERLRQKYGDQHPRTKDVESRARSNKEFREELAVEYGHAMAAGRAEHTDTVVNRSAKGGGTHPDRETPPEPGPPSTPPPAAATVKRAAPHETSGSPDSAGATRAKAAAAKTRSTKARAKKPRRTK